MKDRRLDQRQESGLTPRRLELAKWSSNGLDQQVVHTSMLPGAYLTGRCGNHKTVFGTDVQ